LFRKEFGQPPRRVAMTSGEFLAELGNLFAELRNLTAKLLKVAGGLSMVWDLRGRRSTPRPVGVDPVV
jgi:hypothetical protein